MSITSNRVPRVENNSDIIRIHKNDIAYIISLLTRVYEGEHLEESDIDQLKNIENMDIDARIRHILKDVGVRPGILGYDYLKCALKLVYEDNNYIKEITKSLYPTVAEKHNTTSSRVERAIRHAVEIAFDNPGSDEMRSQIFGNATDWYKGKPTNTHFIAAVVEMLRDV